MSKGAVVISWETAEYLAVFLGQVAWGNNERRRKAIDNLAQGMGQRSMETAKQTWEEKFIWDPPTALPCAKCKRGKKEKTDE